MIDGKSKRNLPPGLTVLSSRQPAIEAVDELLVMLTRIATPKEQEIVGRAREVNKGRKVTSL